MLSEAGDTALLFPPGALLDGISPKGSPSSLDPNSLWFPVNRSRILGLLALASPRVGTGARVTGGREDEWAALRLIEEVDDLTVMVWASGSRRPIRGLARGRLPL